MTISTESSRNHLHHIPLQLYLAFGILVALSVLIKAPIWQLHPQVFSDSPGYLVPALSLLEGRGYGVQENGFRSPTYPILLAFVLAPWSRTSFSFCRDAHLPTCIDKAGKTPDGIFGLRVIAATQASIGLLTTAVLLALGWITTRNLLVATLFGAGYALNPATGFWEISVLTETLTTFLVVLAVYLTLRSERSKGWGQVLLGMILGALALCHMLFTAFSIVPAVFLLVRDWRAGSKPRAPLPWVAPVLIIPLLFLVGWSAFNYSVNGVFSPSIISGYITSQMVAPVLENAPSGYGDITEIYVGYRDAVTRETGSYSGAIFRAWPAMMSASGLTFAELSQKLTRLSFYLIVAYPSSYLQVAQRGWAKFWDLSFYHYDPVPPGLPALVLSFVDRGFQTILTNLFWLSQAVMGVLYLMMRQMRLLGTKRVPFAPFLLFIMTVWYAAVVVTLTSFGDNARYRAHVLPLQYGTIVLTSWAGWRVASQFVKKNSRNLETL